MTPKHPEGLLDQAAKKFFQYKIENDNHIDDDDDDGDDDDDIDVEMIVWEQTVGETGFTSPQFRPAVPATKFAIIIMVDPSSSS